MEVADEPVLGDREVAVGVLAGPGHPLVPLLLLRGDHRRAQDAGLGAVAREPDRGVRPSPGTV